MFAEPALSDSERLDLADRVSKWLTTAQADNAAILAVDRAEPGDVGPSEHRWYVRLYGDEKEFTTVWLTLGQRTLRYETYVMPAPDENAAALYEQLLRRNERLTGCHFSIGMEDGIFLRGEIPASTVSPSALDSLIGTLYATVEQCFQALIRIGFSSRFA